MENSKSELLYVITNLLGEADLEASYDGDHKSGSLIVEFNDTEYLISTEDIKEVEN